VTGPELAEKRTTTAGSPHPVAQRYCGWLSLKSREKNNRLLLLFWILYWNLFSPVYCRTDSLW